MEPNRQQIRGERLLPVLGRGKPMIVAMLQIPRPGFRSSDLFKLMKTSCLTILLLASVICTTCADTNPPAYIQTNGLKIVVRSPSFPFTNHTVRPLSGAPSLRSTQLNASNRLASTAASASATSQPVLQQLQIASGGALASFGLHKIGFAGSLVGAQPVAITTPDNHRLSFRPRVQCGRHKLVCQNPLVH